MAGRDLDGHGGAVGVVKGYEVLAGEGSDQDGDGIVDGNVAGRDEEITESQEAEVEPLRTMQTPETPTQDEIDQHQIDHVPFRPWCRYCLEGFGREDGHFHSEVKRDVPVVSLDYCFLSRRGVFLRTEWQPQENESFIKILVVRDSKSRALFAHAMPQKGGGRRQTLRS